MNMKTSRQKSAALQAGFTLLELMLVCAILAGVLGTVFLGISTVIQRTQSEQTKVDLTQAGREFVDEFERDLHQAGYPNCRMVATVGALTNCPADITQPLVADNPAVAVGLVYVDSTKIIFEGDMNGSGVVNSVQYELVDVNLNNPPASCPCTLQRSEVTKVNADPKAQPPIFSQELQNVVNSGRPVGNAFFGGGSPITGNTAWGATNTAYYAAVATFKDYPVFQAYDQFGNVVPLPVDFATGPTQTLVCSVAATSAIPCIKSIRLTINLLANQTTGADLQTRTRPVTTLVGSARLGIN